jgi:hypothetical protein
VIAATIVAIILVPSPTEAQWGFLLDKLQELSGPTFTTFGGIIRWGYQPGQNVDGADVRDVQELAADLAADSAGEPMLQGATRREEIRQLDTCAALLPDALPTPGDGLALSEGPVDRINRRIDRSRRLLRDLEDDRSIDRNLSGAREATCDAQRMMAALASDPSAVDRGHGFVWRAGGFYRRDVAAQVDALSGQISGEYRFRIPLPWDRGLDFGGEVGLAIHRFSGGGIEPFVHASVPLLINFHPFPRSPSWLVRNLRGSLGWNIFPPFDEDAFDPAIPQVAEQWEGVRMWTVSIDLSASSILWWK